MIHAFTSRTARAARGTAVLCAAFAALCFLFVSATRADARLVTAPLPSDAEPRAARGFTTNDDEGRRSKSTPSVLPENLLAYPPRPSVVAPRAVVYLHGVHGRAENGCPAFRGGASALGWLVCPEPTVPEGPGFSWSSSVTVNDDVVVRAEHAAERAGATGAPVLLGFSQGAYVALDLLARHPGKYRGAILLAADVAPTKSGLGGIARVVLGAGELDGTFAGLERAATRLRAEGVLVRFVSLGRVGHTYVAEDPAALDEAIVWAGGA